MRNGNLEAAVAQMEEDTAGDDAPAPVKTDVAASKAKTRGALLGGLRNGNLEAAIAKMEKDTAGEEEEDKPSPTPRTQLANDEGDRMMDEVLSAAASPVVDSAPTTDVVASKAKTRGDLLGGLRNGNLEAAVAKMEEDTAGEEEAPAPAPAAPKTDVAASKAKTRGALLAGLKNGNLQVAVEKMEADTAGEE